MWSEIVHALNTYWNALAGSIPAIANAVIILIAGWLLALVTQWLAFALCRFLGLHQISEKTGVHRFLERRGFKQGFSGLTAKLFFWLVMLIVLERFFDLLGLPIVAELLGEAIAFIPSLLVAGAIVVVGFYLASFTAGLISDALESAEYPRPALVARIAFYSIAFFSIAIALTQIGIGQTLITNVVSIFFGSAGLAFAIAFGLGGKAWAERLIEKYFGGKEQ
ncbi:MAG: hypothetical protein KBF37_10080 [Saprospiraceae bacterium]|jgi:hypothetical protein|nr:hypothetical protein [Saprospiraceae bacterium]MBV6473850.1 hypothetical protein [Saprospiraceae bacterium]